MADGNTFLVERYIPRLRAADVEALADRLAAATRELQADGRHVRWLRSLVLPDDETCLCLFAATSCADVEEANRRAGAAYERVLPVLPIESDEDG